MSILLAKRSDNQGDRRMLILFCCVMAIGNALIFAFNRHYLTLITFGVLLSALASVRCRKSLPLPVNMLTARPREVVMFSSVMRAQLSLAWVIGPPLSFVLALNYGFTTMFSIAAGLFVVCVALIWFALPSVPRVEQPPEVVITQISAWKNKDVRCCLSLRLLMWTCNTMYIIDMPLYISSVSGVAG